MRSSRASAISSTQRSTADSIPSPSRSIFRKPASAHESLSHWTIWRPSIAAGCTGQMSISGRVESTIPPGCWEMWRGSPQASRASRARQRQRGDAARPAPIASAMSRSTSVAAGVHVGDPGDALDLARRQPERLAEVADRAARAIAGEGRDQRRALAPVAVVDARDQLLADVAREVEVDVGHLGDLVVEEAPEEEPRPHRVDVREPGQVADDRADARAAAAPRGQQVARRVGPANLGRDLARELEQVEVQEEEAREPEPADHPQLLLEPPLGLGALAGAGVAQLEPAAADLGQRPVGVGVLGAGVAVAELAGRGRSAAARRAARSRRPPPGARRSAPPSPPAGRAPSSRCRGARARTPRASCACARRPARPGARPGGGRGRGRCRSPRRRRRAARRARPASGCAPGRAATAAAAARSGSARARRRASSRRASASARRGSPRSQAPASAPSRAQPERQTSPSLRSSSESSASDGGEGVAIGLRPRAGVRLGQQPAEVVPAVGALDQER